MFVERADSAGGTAAAVIPSDLLAPQPLAETLGIGPAGASMSSTTMLMVFLNIIHTLAIAGWFGCQIYSVTLVQRHPAATRDSAYYEDFVTELGSGARWMIIGVLAAALPTWVGIILIRIWSDPAPGWIWITLVATKSTFLLATVLLFVYVSWHLFPLRIFALPSELPEIQRRFLRFSTLIMCALGTALAVGILADAF